MTDPFDAIRDHLSAAYRELEAVAAELGPDERETVRQCRDSLSRIMTRVAALGVLHRAAKQNEAFTGGGDG